MCANLWRIAENKGKERRFPRDSFIKKKLFKKISSVYPPTTVAATNSLLSGKEPIESGCLGWQQYFKQYDSHLQIFTSNPHYKDSKKVSANILGQELYYEKFYSNFKYSLIFQKQTFPFLWQSRGIPKFYPL